jgi:DNA primase
MQGKGEDIVEQVRMATDIVEIIGSYVALKLAGKDYKACCPFHREKTPSFHVSPDRQLYHCFGCGEGGDIYSFVMKQEGLTFPEAVEMLAGRAGIAMPERGAGGGQRGPDRATLIGALKAAVRYYRRELDDGGGKSARDYLANRGITAELISAYYIGYAPGGNALLALAGKKMSVDTLLAAGLVGKNDHGGFYDRFRDRTVIPILSAVGEPLGFGARAMRADVTPKYLNSPETALYKKARILFGLPQARPAIKSAESVLVVEGYFDVLSLAGAGFGNAVAPCGTALTTEHVKILLRYTKRIILLFDGDSAGDAAAWRAMEAVLPVHPDVEIAMLPAGKDPDDLIQEGETVKLGEIIASPLSPIAFAMVSLERQGIDGHERVTRIANMLSWVGNAIAREMLIDKASARTGVAIRVLRPEVDRLRQGPQRRRGGGAGDGDQPPAGPGDLPPKAPPAPLSAVEKAILRLLQLEPEAAELVGEAAHGVPSVRRELREILVWVADRVRSGQAPQMPEILRRLTAEMGQGQDLGFLLQSSEEDESSSKYREELLRHLRVLAIENELEQLGYQIKSLDPDSADKTKLDGLLQHKQALARDLVRLKSREERI